MKLIKLIFLSACLATSIQSAAQDLDPEEIYYGIEIISETPEEDTSSNYQVILIIRDSDLDLFRTIEVESSKNFKALKVSKEDRKDNDRVKLKSKNYHLDMQEWSEDEELIVKAKMLDGTKVKLKKHPRGSEFTHKVLTVKQKRRNVKRSDGPGIVEDEYEQ
jgi:hypothetical protein